METVRLNEKLISSLGNVIFMATAEMIATTAIPNSTFYRIMQTPAAISIQQLLAIANALHIPVRRFFSTDMVDYVGKREDYITDPYEPCYYDEAALQELVESSRDITWQKAAKATGINYTNLRKSLLAATRTPVTRFLTVCDVFDIDPFSILVDPNSGIRTRRKDGRQEGGEPAELAELKENIRKLSCKVEDLMAKYENLFEAHKTLMRRLDEHISDTSPAMAAEM